MKDLFISDVHGEYEQYLHVMREALECAQDPDVNLHIVGDIYDRGPSPDLVMEDLLNRETVDIQWGNHDVVWMGAALGQPCCVPIVVRICARYGNLPTLEETYGIDSRKRPCSRCLPRCGCCRRCAGRQQMGL